MRLISRKEAAAEGRLFYFTGKPCKRGHITKRKVSNRLCGGCAHELQRKYEQRDVEKRRAKSLAYQHRKLPAPTRPRPDVCELCGNPPKVRALHLDHDHRTGKFRGWLCANCNTSIGKLGDSAESLNAVMMYLRRAQGSILPESAEARKQIPLWSGLFGYFASALIEVARVSYIGNQQHNPGQSLFWARGKSTDHRDALARHFSESGKVDADGTRHSAKLAWRALALLQEELEREEGAPLAPNARAA